MRYVVAFFGFCVSYKFIRNIICYFRIKFLKSKFIDWITFNGNNDLPTYKIEVIRLFKSAGVKDREIPTSQSVGYGHFVSFNASLFLNFPNNKQILVGEYLDMFDEAIGEYRRRFIESFSPLYWIDCILFAPRNLLDYLGLDKEQASYKLLNVVFTIIWWVVGGLLTFFNEQIKTMVINLLEITP